MRGACILSGALLLLAAPAAAQEVPSAAVPAADGPATEIAALREDLVAAQREIVRLQGEVHGLRDADAALKAAREKNARLVAIADELIAAYAKRFGRGEFLPFDTGRRKLEVELQELGDRVYDNRWEAGPRREPPASPRNPAPSTETSKPDAQ